MDIVRCLKILLSRPALLCLTCIPLSCCIFDPVLPCPADLCFPRLTPGQSAAAAEGTGDEPTPEPDRRPASDSGQELDKPSDVASAVGETAEV